MKFRLLRVSESWRSEEGFLLCLFGGGNGRVVAAHWVFAVGRRNPISNIKRVHVLFPSLGRSLSDTLV